LFRGSLDKSLRITVFDASGAIAGTDADDVCLDCSTDIEFADGFELLLPDPVIID